MGNLRTRFDNFFFIQYLCIPTVFVFTHIPYLRHPKHQIRINIDTKALGLPF